MDELVSQRYQPSACRIGDSGKPAYGAQIVDLAGSLTVNRRYSHLSVLAPPSHASAPLDISLLHPADQRIAGPFRPNLAG